MNRARWPRLRGCGRSRPSLRTAAACPPPARSRARRPSRARDPRRRSAPPRTARAAPRRRRARGLRSPAAACAREPSVPGSSRDVSVPPPPAGILERPAGAAKPDDTIRALMPLPPTSRAFGRAFLAAALVFAVAAQTEPSKMNYPDAPRSQVVDDYHGTKVADPYRWLEEPDSPATARWVDAENALTRSLLDGPERDAIKK